MRIEWKSRLVALLGLVAIAWIATDAVGAIANSPERGPAVSAIEEATCNPRDPLSACFQRAYHFKAVIRPMAGEQRLGSAVVWAGVASRA